MNKSLQLILLSLVIGCSVDHTPAPPPVPRKPTVGIVVDRDMQPEKTTAFEVYDPVPSYGSNGWGITLVSVKRVRHTPEAHWIVVELDDGSRREVSLTKFKWDAIKIGDHYPKAELQADE